MRRVFAVLMLFAAAANPQQIGQNTSGDANATATFSANAQLVVETVMVTDKNGNPMKGLTAQDFTVTENDAPQSIKVF